MLSNRQFLLCQAKDDYKEQLNNMLVSIYLWTANAQMSQEWMKLQATLDATEKLYMTRLATYQKLATLRYLL